MLFSFFPSLFSCFRVKKADTTTRSHGSKLITAVHKESIDCQDRNCLRSVLVSEENSDYLDIEVAKCGVAGSPVSDGLRAETQAEIRKEEKSKVSQAHNEDTESPIHSWYPNAALEKTLGKEPDQLQSPVNLFNKRENGPEPSSISSSSCKTGKSTSSIFTNSSGGSVKHVDDAKSLDSSASHTPSVPTTQFKNESVHFEDQSVAFSFSSRSSSPRTANERSNPSETPFSHNSSKPSPYPTPLKLSDDMQTPGTDFPSYVYDNESGKNKRIRSQFKAPKLWGGNGIPNTTTKYKEDLKVSWHATAFEQRLEMALLEDHCIPKRKELGETPPIDY